MADVYELQRSEEGWSGGRQPARRGQEKLGKSKLSFLSDVELKRLAWYYGYSGAVEKIKQEYGIAVTPQTFRNELERRGIQARSHDIKDGLSFEGLCFDVCYYLEFDDLQHLGLQVGNGCDIYLSLIHI